MNDEDTEMTPRQEAYAAIDSERAYQDMMWGDTLSGGREPGEGQQGGDRSVDEFSCYIVGYAQKLLATACTSPVDREKLEIIRKIGGLAVACMEQHGAPRREGY